MGELLRANQFFTGGLVLALLGMLTAAALHLPGQMWKLVQRYGMTTMFIREQELVRWVSEWLEASSYGKRCRWLEAFGYWTIGKFHGILRPGFGLHVFKEAGTRYWILSETEDAGIAGNITVLTLRTMGRDDMPLRNLIVAATEAANMSREGKNAIYTNEEAYWERARLFPHRTKETVFLDEILGQDILNDAFTYTKREAWYRVRGIPYRRGYLLHGPPGNGKSTLVQWLATELEWPVYLMSVSDPDLTDSKLAALIGRVPKHAILVLEDFEKLKWEELTITLPGLLNAVDGPIASEGRLLVITANDRGKLDTHLLRPGRIDRTWYIGPPSIEAIEQCMDAFGVNGNINRNAFQLEAQAKTYSMADVQQKLMLSDGEMK